jgi:hypothetical protein
MHMIRPLFFSALLGLTLAGTQAIPMVSHAQVASKPLVVIRFNQPRVYYDKQLYSAISQAVAAKPDVMFEVVSNAPLTGNGSTDEQWIKTASRNTQAVVASMQTIGIPMQRMRVTGKAMPGLRYDETHIYAY